MGSPWGGRRLVLVWVVILTLSVRLRRVSVFSGMWVLRNILLRVRCSGLVCRVSLRIRRGLMTIPCGLNILRNWFVILVWLRLGLR